MTYATLADLADRFSYDEMVSVADRDNDGIVDDAVVDTAIADAGEMIDGYLAGRYGLPLAQTPGLVKGWCCDIARRRLHKDSPPDEVVKNYDEAVRALRDVAAGKLTLQVAGITAPAAAVSDTQVLFAPAERMFSVDSLKGY